MATTSQQQQQHEQPNGTSARDPNFYAGFSRFEIELEFVQSLSNPLYLNHLAVNKYLDDPAFIEYIKYLEYFRQPQYVKFLQWPGPTLRALELLQQEAFRRDVVGFGLVEAMMREGMEAAAAVGQRGGGGA